MKKILVFLLVACASIEMYADSFATFSFEKADGSIKNIPAVGTKIIFSNSTLSAVNSASRADILLNDIAYMYFSNQATDVNNIATHAVRIWSEAGTILLTAPNNNIVRVLNITGQQINETLSTGEAQSIATQLSNGVYIVQVGSETYKTIVR